MKILWKQFSQTKGYKSLKAAYAHDVDKKWRNKEVLLNKFYWVIGRAKHYSQHTDKSVEFILNDWESKRDYWWLNYYQDCNQPKFHNNSKKNADIKGIRKYYKNQGLWMTPQRIKNRICEFIQEKQRKASTKKKKRWTMDYKKSKCR